MRWRQPWRRERHSLPRRFVSEPCVIQQDESVWKWRHALANTKWLYKIAQVRSNFRLCGKSLQKRQTGRWNRRLEACLGCRMLSKQSRKPSPSLGLYPCHKCLPNLRNLVWVSVPQNVILLEKQQLSQCAKPLDVLLPKSL